MELDFTKEQLSAEISKHAARENGLHDLLEIMLKSMNGSRARLVYQW